MQIYQGEPLNILHTIGMKTRYPIIRVHFKINGILDLNHFKMSVMQLKTVIPELFCKYRLSDNSFIPVTDNADDILFQDINPDQDCSDWDLFKDPQWRIYLNRINNGYDVTIFLSHILMTPRIILRSPTGRRGYFDLFGKRNCLKKLRSVVAVGSGRLVLAYPLRRSDRFP